MDWSIQETARLTGTTSRTLRHYDSIGRERARLVRQRWGDAAYETSDQWWTSLSEQEKSDRQSRVRALSQDWAGAAETGLDPESDAAQELARRHVDWLTSMPGTPASDPGGDTAGYVRGLAEMYVGDARFAANYGGEEGARFVRDALLIHLDRN